MTATTYRNYSRNDKPYQNFLAMIQRSHPGVISVNKIYRLKGKQALVTCSTETGILDLVSPGYCVAEVTQDADEIIAFL